MDSEETPLKQIRTFQGDVAEALQRQQESLVSIQRAEYLRKNTNQSSVNISQENSKRKTDLFFLVIGSFILFSLGVAGAWYAYNEFVRRATTPIIVAPANRFLSTNTEKNLDLTSASRETLINTLSITTENIPSENLWHIILRKGPGSESPFISTSEFLTILESQAPGSLIRAFDSIFMFGALGESPVIGGTSTFLIIKLVSFENAFAGMLEWEKNMSQDIGPLFITAPLLRGVPPETVFVDITDRNKDVRMLKYKDRGLLLYTFFDNNMLIITDNIETLRILIDRLTREKLSR